MQDIDYQVIFREILDELKGIEDNGNVASYIPELANVDSRKLGLHLTTTDQQHFSIGDCAERFSIQSISKVFTLVLAFKTEGERLWNRVGIEPSGSPFNSLVQLEYERGIPRNPFINAGAIVICDVLVSCLDNPKQAVLEFIRELSGNSALSFNAKVAESEKQFGFRNKSLIYLMKDFGNIQNDIEIVLDFYFYLCSIEMTCKELAQSFSFLASGGKNPLTGEAVVGISETKRINAIMQLCGFYDEAGEFSFKVGLPGKSGVGGGIVAIHPCAYSIAVWSPKLNNNGNSFKGMKALEILTTKTEKSIF